METVTHSRLAGAARGRSLGRKRTGVGELSFSLAGRAVEQGRRWNAVDGNVVDVICWMRLKQSNVKVEQR